MPAPPTSFMTSVKKMLSQALPDSRRLRILSWLPRLETWRQEYAGKCPTFEHRYKMYEWLNQSVLQNVAIDYLEFGVFEGDSIRRWSELNSNPKSRFTGFDTFTGLPETWDTFTGPVEGGYFNVGGAFPKINDARVSFVKGLFQESLPGFRQTFSTSDQLVVHIDADLYSATLYVLTYLNDLLKPGTVVVFDEFSSILHEFRAMEDYCASYMRKYEALAVVCSEVDYYSQIAVRMTA